MKLSGVFFLSLSFFAAAAAAAPAERAIVERVVDGDTLTVRVSGRREGVRLIGVDTPESSPNDRAQRVSKKYHKDMALMLAQGKRAAAFTESLAHAGDALKLEFDVQQRDAYGRLLAYVYLADGRMLNELLVKEGFAYSMTVPPNVRYSGRFRGLMNAAREQRRGLWADGD